jgi:hypothetical protein
MMNGAKKPSEKIVHALITVPMIGAASIVGIVISPFVAILIGIDLASDAYKKRKEKYNENKKIKHDWNYRFTHFAVSIHTLKKWQEFVLELNQYERAVVQIAEAKDVPFELWHMLVDDCEHANYFTDMMHKLGTPLYDKEKTKQLALDFFIKKYALLKNIPIGHADEHMKYLLDRVGLLANQSQ